MDQTAFHLREMTRHFEAGRFASARWHCRVWTRLMAQRVFPMTAQAAQPGRCNPVHAGTPSPFNGLVGRTGNE